MKKFILSAALMLPLTVSASTVSDRLMTENTNTNIEKNHGLMPTLENKPHLISVNLTQLIDNTGLQYIGGIVAKKDLAPFLAQLKQTLGEEFNLYRNAQQLRDHNQFHITLVNPYEYKALTQEQQKLVEGSSSFQFTLLGLGHVSKEQSNTYFVVAQSSTAQQLRKALKLKPKDFHATLGFKPQDIYGVPKNKTTLIK